MKGWDSRRVIGEIQHRYSEWENRALRNPINRNLYAAFYNGWIEGRVDILMEIEKDNESKCLFECPKCGSGRVYFYCDVEKALCDECGTVWKIVMDTGEQA